MENKPMKFMCLHGAIANTDNFKIQMDPIVRELISDNTATFVWPEGTVKVDPPEGFGEYFGRGPHYRWLDDDGTAQRSMLERIRQFPLGEDSPEDTLRKLMTKDASNLSSNESATIQHLYDFLEAEEDIEGIIGYSEGALVSATLMFDEQLRFQNDGRPKRIKCAIFITGWPAISLEDGHVLLADETDDYIHNHSIHIVGANDPYKAGALALYNFCDADTAVLFDTGKGHTLPRTGPILKELGDEVRKMIARCRKSA